MHSPETRMINNGVWALAILLLTVLIYGTAYDAGFVTDFTGLHSKMQGKGLGAALHSFGFPSLMPLLNVTYWLLEKICGLHGAGWFLFAAGCSSLTLLIFYKLARLLLDDFGYTRRKVLAIATTSCALVLFSPYQVEAIIWKVGLGHLMSVWFFMWALYQLVRYVQVGTRRNLVGSLIALMLSLFCFEWGLVFPAMAAVLLLGYWRLGQLTPLRAMSIFTFTLIPVIIYLILTKLVLGSWLGHYDTETDMDLEVMTMTSTTLKYFIKHLSLTHFYPNELKQSVYALADKTWFILLVLGVMVSMVGYGFVRGQKATLKAMALSWAMLGLVLVSGLYFSNLLLSENDRYGSLFIYFLAFIVALLIAELPRWLGYGLLFFMLLIQMFFQQKLVTQWSRSQDQIEKITKTYRNLDIRENDKVLMLNLPENLCGTFMFRDFSGQNPIVDHLNMFSIAHPQMDLVAQYNLPIQGQAFTGKWIAKGRIRLDAKEWGSWWWRKGLGVGKYETIDYIFEPLTKAIEVQLKEGHTYTKIIYFDGEGWQVI